MSCDILLKFQWIRSQRNLVAWFSSTVILFSRKCKRLWFSSRVTCVSNMFVVCGMDTGLFWMISSFLYITSLIGLGYASVVIDTLLAISKFSLGLSWLFEVGKIIFKVSLVTPSCCLIFFQVCVHGQSYWPWLMSIDILLKKLKSWCLKTYV